MNANPSLRESLSRAEYETQKEWIALVRGKLPTASEDDLRSLAETCFAKLERFMALAVDAALTSTLEAPYGRGGEQT